MVGATLEHKLATWEAEARQQVVCTGCYGSGEDRWREGRACPECAGRGKAAREPHVLELIEIVRGLLSRA